MTSLVKVARLHLVDRFGYTWLVWGVLTLTFVINLVIFAVVPLTQPSGNFTGALANYQAYLKLLPKGPYAEESQKGIDRLKTKAGVNPAPPTPKPS